MPKPNSTKTITWTADNHGYQIFVTQGSSIIDEYSAGNSPHDSIQVVPLSDPNRIRITELKRLARRTARELAIEHRIPTRNIQFEYALA
jgi:hypothetical protein